ncbi:MAG: hypothetical protein HUJ54_10145 [Erysipelotrichaceae bacterium]|nr:hypothetical protein [Erysipelotrichaceae bacterium]
MKSMMIKSVTGFALGASLAASWVAPAFAAEVNQTETKQTFETADTAGSIEDYRKPCLFHPVFKP